MRQAAWKLQLILVVGLSGLVQPGWAEEFSGRDAKLIPAETLRERVFTPVANIPRVRELQHPATTVQVTGVRLNRIEADLELVLDTQDGKLLPVDASKFRTEGNSLIADIPNAVLALPEGQTFAAENPTADVTNVRVVQQGVNNIRVSVTGNNALPKTEVTLKTGDLAYSLNPEADELDEEIVVTGKGQGRYNVPNASTATRTDTPLRDIPQSIQVVPRQVIEDRNARTIAETVETVSGVVNRSTNFGTPSQALTIRGFNQTGNFRNGFRDVSLYEIAGGTNAIDRIEVLKGPASILFGQVEPGGIVNVVTRQPLSEPYYNLTFEAGSFGYHQPIIDLSGPLTTDKTVLYRFIGSYEASGSFQAFGRTNFTTVAPSITFNIGERTTLNLYYEYLDFNADPPIEPV